jgi:hypothetical protein
MSDAAVPSGGTLQTDSLSASSASSRNVRKITGRHDGRAGEVE